MRSGQKMPPMENYSQKRICEYNKEDHNSWISPFACMSEVAEMCVTTYYSRLQTWTTIPVGDREDACGFVLIIYPLIDGWFMMFNTTFNNISVRWWWSVLLVEETGVSREHHRPAASH
jgi:hypothetical protein